MNADRLVKPNSGCWLAPFANRAGTRGLPGSPVPIVGIHVAFQCWTVPSEETASLDWQKECVLTLSCPEGYCPWLVQNLALRATVWFWICYAWLTWHPNKQRNTVGSECQTIHCWLPEGSFPRVPTAAERGESLSFLFLFGIRFKQMCATSCQRLRPSSPAFSDTSNPNAKRLHVTYISMTWFILRHWQPVGCQNGRVQS